MVRLFKENLLREYLKKVNGQENCVQQEFYLLHKSGISENVENANPWMYQASARERSQILSLKDCLEKGPFVRRKTHFVINKSRKKIVTH